MMNATLLKKERELENLKGEKTEIRWNGQKRHHGEGDNKL